MRSPIDLVMGRVGGFAKTEIARRTVPCYKYVVEPDGERLALCLLVDSKYLYRYPYEKVKGTAALAIKARYLRGEMEHLRLREFQPGVCRYLNPRPAAPSPATGPHPARPRPLAGTTRARRPPGPAGAPGPLPR